MRLYPAEFAPDQPNLSEFTDMILNAIPYTQRSYGPIGQLGEVGEELTLYCRGAESGRGTDGTTVTFASDGSDWYSWSGVSWAVVTATSISYATADDDNVGFLQFGNVMLTFNGTNDIARWDIGSSSLFTPLVATSGTVPIPAFAWIVKDFITVGRIAGNLNRIQWPDINSVTEWGAGQASSQDFPIGGRVMGGVGGEYGTVFLESAIYAQTYIGPPDIFQFDVLSLERGCDSSGSIASYQGSIFFHAPDGFWLMSPGGGLTPIGDQKIDQWFSDRVDKSYLYRIVSKVDPLAKIYYIAYPTLEDGSGRCQEILAYNWTAQRWALINQPIDFIFGARTDLGYNLDTLGSIYPNIDTMPISLDSNLLTGSQNPTLAVFTPDKKMAFFGSTPMTAYIDTVEGEPASPNQAFVQGIRPQVSGSTTISCQVSRRNRLNDARVWGPIVTQNAQGRCPQRSQGRYQKARVILTGGDWQKFEGVDFEAIRAGKR